MSWREKSTLGEQVVATIVDRLNFDPKFILDTQNGLTYWSGDFATHIETDQGVFRGSKSEYRVTCETEFIRGRGHLRELAMALPHEMDHCSLSGPIYNKDRDTFALFCGIYASDERAIWLTETFLAATMLQISDAYELSDRLGKHFHASGALSGHPHRGIRETIDHANCNAWDQFSSGNAESAWINCPAWQQASWMMEREAQSFETNRQTYLSAKFDWAIQPDQCIDLEFQTNEPHPKLGAGLEVTLTIPMKFSQEGLGHLVIDLNTYERVEYKRCHSLGSWCEHNGKLAYREFLPNKLYAEDYLDDICVNFCTRAIWANEWFYEMKCKAAQS